MPLAFRARPLALSQSDEGNCVRISGQSRHTKQHPLRGPQEQGCVRPALPLASRQLIGPANRLRQIDFIRGLVSPSWVSAIGSKYNIDPEFFLRHMGLPSLATSSDNVSRLCVSTVFHRDDFGGQDLCSQRLEEVAGLERYKMQQPGSNRVSCGDSLVREYSTVCSSSSVLEQCISLCVAKTERGWSGWDERSG
jgi:hypothetical protein